MDEGTCSSKRYGWIISMRVIAAAAIVMLHTISGWQNYTGSQTQNFRSILDGIVLQVAVRWAVPFFIMISGFLLLDPNKKMPLEKIKRYIFRMSIVLLTIGYIFCLIESIAVNGLISPLQIIIISLKNLIEGKSWTHMWYVYMLIGLYILTPILRIYTAHADAKTKQFTMTCLFILTLICPTLEKLLRIDLAQILPVSSCYLFYYLGGNFFSSLKWSRKTVVSTLVIGVIGVSLSCLAQQRNLTDTSPENVFVAILTISIFKIASNSNYLERISNNNLICSISKCSFGIYLFHPVILNILNKLFHISPDILPVLIGEVVFFAFTFISSYCLTWILCKIPMISKLLR